MRLLVAQDDKVLQEYLKKNLEKEGFAVDVVDNGIDAEHLGMQESYDAIVLDVELPQRSGIKVLDNWRQAGIRAPVMMLTGHDAWEDKVSSFNAGGDDYLGMPFHIEEVVARLNALIRRSYGRPCGMLKMKGLALNEDKQSAITADGNEVALTGIEFRMLRYFMLRAGHMLSRSDLTGHIYNFDSDKDSNVIEVYINRLRHKLGEMRITTHRGQGYVFETDG